MIGRVLANTGPLAPAWVVFPLAGFTLVVVMWHISGLVRADLEPSRRRIRLANGGVMLALVPLIAFAFGVATTSEPRWFAMSWLAVMGLLGLMIVLAIMDSANTARMHAAERLELRRQTREALRIAAASVREPERKG
jgi:hypothetical protein